MASILTGSNHLVWLIELVEREDVDAYAKQERKMLELPNRTLQVGNLGKRHVVAWSSPIEEFVAATLKFVSKTKQSLIILSGHINVDVIVPRNEAFVADSTQNGSTTTDVAKPMLLEEFLRELEHFQQTNL